MHPIETDPVTLVDLLRHGMPVGGKRYRGSVDDPLAEEGWNQMWSAVGRYRDWDVVVTSPLRRCAEFAQALAEQYGLPLERESRLREISFGDWEGRTVTDILDDDPAQIERYWADPLNNTPPNGESLRDFNDRTVAAWDDLVDRHHGKRVLVVAHGGVMRMLLTHALGMPVSAVLRWEVPNASISRVRVQPDINGRLFPSLVFHAGRVADSRPGNAHG